MLCPKFEELPVGQEATRLYNRVLDLLETPSLRAEMRCNYCRYPMANRHISAIGD